MPKEIKDVDEFVRLSEKAEYCLVKRVKKENKVKLKLRTKKYLYTLKTTPERVDEILKNVKCEIREI
jgi:large subunit ribosomal protein L38e